MKHLFLLWLVVALLGTGACASNTSSQTKAIGGLWSMQLTFTAGRNGSTSGDLTIDQVGTALNFHFQNPGGFTFTATGTLTGTAMTFSDQYVVDWQLNEQDFEGHILPDGTLSGTFTWKNLGIPDLPAIQGTWTAQQQG